MIELYDRAAYWLFTLEIPLARGKELVSAVKIKLNSLYPGNIESRDIQIRKNGAKKWSYLVFVLDKDTGNKMLPLSPLFIQHLYARETANVIYADKKWLDYIRVENGTINSSIVKIRDETMSLDDVKNLSGEETDLTIFCDKDDREFFAPLQENNNIQFFDSYSELKKIDVHKIALFSAKSPVKKRQRVLAAAAALFLFILSSWTFYQLRQSKNERDAQSRVEQETRQKEVERQKRENEYLLELKNQYQEIIAAKTISPFDLAAIIAECAEPRIRIQSATFNGNFFQIEGITGNSLGLLSNFENHRLVSDVRLHQVHPSFNMDAFTLSGTARPETASIDENLPAGSQIIILENLIESETNYSSRDADLSPSAFGEAVNSLFSGWGCTVSSYQFLNEPSRTEIEFSLRGAGNAFFNALYELKTKHRLWEARVTQIKNLYPRDMLEIIIRVRTTRAVSKPGYTDTPSSGIADPYPVSGISRNYFIPAPASRPAERAPVITPARAERVSWLEYVGSIRDDRDIRYIYLKNTRTGAMLKLGNFNEGNMRYISSQTGSIIAYIDDNIYEINGR